MDILAGTYQRDNDGYSQLFTTDLGSGKPLVEVDLSKHLAMVGHSTHTQGES
jgi:hypothetical protein